MWQSVAVLLGLVAVSCSTACGSFAGDCSGGVYSGGRCVSTQPAIHWTAAKAQAAADAFDQRPMVPGRFTQARCRIVRRYPALDATAVCNGVFLAPGQSPRKVVAAFSLSGIGVINPDCQINWQTSPYCSGKGQDVTSGDRVSANASTRRVEQAMLQAAKAGQFQAPPSGHHYAAPVECRVDQPNGFHGQPIYLCKVAISKLPYGYLWEWGAWYQGSLHTHTTDPQSIRTITGPFDPPW
jgi:hypothetical protein